MSALLQVGGGKDAGELRVRRYGVVIVDVRDPDTGAIQPPVSLSPLDRTFRHERGLKTEWRLNRSLLSGPRKPLSRSNNGSVRLKADVGMSVGDTPPASILIHALGSARFLRQVPCWHHIMCVSQKRDQILYRTGALIVSSDDEHDLPLRHLP